MKACELNPAAVHSRLGDIIQRLDTVKDKEVSTVLALLTNVAAGRAEVTHTSRSCARV